MRNRILAGLSLFPLFPFQLVGQVAGDAKPADPAVALAAPELSSTNGESTRWSLLHRVFFRLAFIYFTVYLSYVFPDHEFPDVAGRIGYLPGKIAYLWNSAMSWVGVHLFHFTALDMRPVFSGGDALVEYVQVFAAAVLALIGAATWSILDRKTVEHNRLDGFLRLLVRYSLAYIILDYGFSKLFPLQFKPPFLWTLLRPYGEFTPQSVLWQFMGVSQAYTIFSGAIEVLGGLLLLFRKTATAGAIVCAAALTNVVMLDLCYDVGVKLYSIHLLLMAVFLLLPDMKPVFELLVLRRTAVPASLTEPRYQNRLGRLGAQLLWVLFVVSVLYTNISHQWPYYKHTYIDPEIPPIHGVYEVESFSRNGREIPPQSLEPRWKNISFDGSAWGRGPGYVHIRTMDEQPNQWTRFYFRVEFDSVNSSFALAGLDPATRRTVRFPFHYSLSDSDHVLLDGTFKNDQLSVRLRKIDTSKYILTKRRFRWVQPNGLGLPAWSTIE